MQVIRPVIDGSGGLWVASAASREDFEFAERGDLPQEEGFSLRLVRIGRREHQLHYEVICTQILAPMFHYLFDLSRSPLLGREFLAAWNCYRAVNETFAASLADIAGTDTVLIEDFHLLLVAEKLRQHRSPKPPVLSYFHHVAWCEPDYFGVLPGSIRHEILSALLAYDSVGFHARRWARAFVSCCDRFLTGAVCTDDQVQWRDRVVRVCVAPAAVDAARIRAAAQRPDTCRRLEELESRRQGRKTLVRIDRADRWKNVERGFLAFEALLERRPALVASTWFVALLAPTRMWIRENRGYWRACLRAAQRINGRFRREAGGRGPIDIVESSENHDEALATLRIADCLLVNPLFDGLNLVAKEGAVAAKPDGTLVLSRNTGAYEEFGQIPLTINPFDLEETAAAIERGLEMDPNERTQRRRQLFAVAEANTPDRWLARRVKEIR